MRRLAALTAFGIFSAALLTARAQERPVEKIDEMTEAQKKSIAKGVEWLLRIQNQNGLWGCEKADSPSAAITSLAVLALCAGGSTPDEGPHAAVIRKAVARLIAIQGASGQISTQFDTTAMGLFYDHSCATLCLAEVHGMRKDAAESDEVRAALERAVGYLYKKQGPDGGWDPQGTGGAGDLAITCNVWMALRASHNAGLKIEHANVQKIEQFVMKCADPAGGFSLYAGQRGNNSRMFYPTSAGLRILYGMGRRDMKEVERGAEILLKKKPGDDYGGQISEWDYCAAFFAVMAMMHEGDRYWRKWYPMIRDFLVKIQNQDGSWTIQYCKACRAYATALSLLVLQAPKRLLPLFQL